MSEQPLKHLNRPLTAEERERHVAIRAGAAKDYPPRIDAARQLTPSRIPAKVRAAREARGLTWHALAQAADIESSATIRDIEQGVDVRVSDLQAVAAVLGLQLELVEVS